MPATKRTNRVEVRTTGRPTLEEIERTCADARRAGIPGDTIALQSAVAGAGGDLGFVYDFDAPHPADAPTERLTAPVRPAFPMNPPIPPIRGLV